jgi:hypothetical protein
MCSSDYVTWFFKDSEFKVAALNISTQAERWSPEKVQDGVYTSA